MPNTRCALGLGVALLLALPASHARGAQGKPPGAGAALPGVVARFGADRWRQGKQIVQLAASADGKLLVCSSDAEGIVLWDVAAGKRLRQFAPADKSAVYRFALSADGRLLARHPRESTKVHLDDLRAGKPAGAVELPVGEVFDLVLSQDGKFLAACVRAEKAAWPRVDLWDTATGKHLWGFADQGGPLAFGAGGKTVLIGGRRRVRVRESASGKEVERLEGPAWALATSADGRLLAVLGEGTADIWDLPRGQRRRLALPKGAADDPARLLLSASGGTVVLCGPQGLFAWDTATGLEVGRAADFKGLDHAALSADGKVLYWTSSDLPAIGRWDVAASRDPDASGGPAGAIGLGFVGGDDTLVSFDLQGRVQFWDVPGRKAKAGMPALKGTRFQGLFDIFLDRLRFSPEGKSFALFAADGTLQLRDGATGQLLRRVGTFTGPTGLAFSPDGKLLATGEADGDANGRVQLWEAATGRLLRTLRGSGEPGSGFAFTADGKSLVTGGHGLRVWDVTTGKLLRRLTSESAGFLAPAGPGRLAGMEGAVVVWDIATGRELFRASGGPLQTRLAVSPDGRLLATGDAHGQLRLLDSGTGAILAAFATPGESAVGALAFSPSGKRLAVSCDDPGLLVWDVEAVVRHAGERTRAERQKWEPARLWEELGHADPAVAVRAVWALARRPEAAVTLLEDRLAKRKPVLPPEKFAALIEQLGNAAFAKRRAAAAALEKLGAAAVPELLRAQQRAQPEEIRRRLEQLLARFPLDGPMVPAGEGLRGVRVVEVLERAGTPPARRLLQALGKDPDPWISREARAVLERLRRADGRKATPPAPDKAKGPADALGDPLPTGAAARLGTARLRQGDRIGRLAFSGDGQLLGTAGDWHVRVWRASDGKELASRRVENESAPRFALSPDGSRLAFGGTHGTVGVLDPRSGKTLQTLALERGSAATQLCFAPDGRSLVTIEHGRVKVWNLKTGRAEKTFSLRHEKHNRSLEEGVAISPDCRWIALVSGGAKTAILLHSVATGKVAATLTSDDGGVKALAFSPDSRHLGLLFEGGFTSAVEVHELATGKLLRRAPLGGQFWSLAMGPDGKTAALGSPNRPAQLWDYAAGTMRPLPHTGRGYSEAVALSPDGRALAVAEEDGLVRLWDVASLRETSPRGFEGFTVPLGFAPDGRTLLIHAGPGLHAWEILPPQQPASPWRVRETRRLTVGMDVVLSPDRRLVAERIWFQLYLRDPADGRELQSIKLHNGHQGAAVAGRRRRVAVLNGGRITLYDADTGKRLRRFPAQAGPEPRMTFSPDEKALVVLGGDEKVRLAFLDPETGKRLRSLEIAERRDSIRRRPGVAVSPDGRLLAVTAREKLLVVDAASGKILHRLKHHEVFAFSPDGKTLAGAHWWDSTIRLYDVASGKMTAELTGHRGRIAGLCFSPDGRLLASGASDMTVLLWDLRKNMK